MILPIWTHFLLLFSALSFSRLLFLEHSSSTSIDCIFCLRHVLACRDPHPVSLGLCLNTTYSNQKKKKKKTTRILRFEPQGQCCQVSETNGSRSDHKGWARASTDAGLMLFRTNSLAILQLSCLLSHKGPHLLSFSAPRRATQSPHQKPSKCGHVTSVSITVN